MIGYGASSSAAAHGIMPSNAGGFSNRHRRRRILDNEIEPLRRRFAQLNA
jgi:hypothetical protein